MSSIIERYALTMTKDDTLFFEQLGQRIAQLRKEQGMTQVQLAEFLVISQQHMASFEKGIRKIPASMLPKLAKLFGISLEMLLGEQDKPSKRGPTPKLLQQVEQVSRLPRAKQKFVMEMLETVLQQTG